MVSIHDVEWIVPDIAEKTLAAVSCSFITTVCVGLVSSFSGGVQRIAHVASERYDHGDDGDNEAVEGSR